jgi:hypothetical protein
MATEQNPAAVSAKPQGASLQWDTPFTLILVDVDQKEAIRRGHNVATSKVRVPVDVTKLDDKQRDFVSRHLNVKDLSIALRPTGCCTDKSFSVIEGTHDDFVREVQDFLNWEAQVALEKKNEFDAKVEKIKTVIDEIIILDKYDKATGSVNGVTSFGTTVSVNHHVMKPVIYNPKNGLWYQDVYYGGEIFGEVPCIFETPAWKQYLAKMDLENEKLKATAESELRQKIERAEIVHADSLKASAEIRKIWLGLEGKDENDRDMIAAGLVDESQMVEDILAEIITVSDFDESDWTAERLKKVTRPVFTSCRDKILNAERLAAFLGLSFKVVGDIDYWLNINKEDGTWVNSATFGFMIFSINGVTIAQSGSNIKKIEIEI